MTPRAGRALTDAWRMLWADPGPLLIGAAALFAALVALNVFDLALAPLDPVDRDKLTVYFAVAIPWTILVLVPLAVGLDHMAVLRVRGVRPHPRDVFVAYQGRFTGVGTYLLLFLALTAGFLLFVIPGIILTLSLLFAPLYARDQRMPPRQALRASMIVTRGRMGTVLAFVLAGAAVLVVGTALVLVGLVPAMAWLFLARAELYRQMRGEDGPGAPHAAG